MTTVATALRDAAFDRAVRVIPSGFDAWALARKFQAPTINTTDLPTLQVTLANERLSPDGDANVGAIRFISDCVIAVSVFRGLDDPAVLDGAADADLDNILVALFEDGTFSNPPRGSPWYFEGVPSIDNRRHFVQSAEAYVMELALQITFRFRLIFSPPAPYWLEEIDINTKGFGVTTISEMGEINATVIGPAVGSVAQPTQEFLFNLEAGASFTGNQWIRIDDGGAGGLIAPSFGSPALGTAVVTPANGAMSFRFVYTPASSGNVVFSFTNGQGWPDPPPKTISVS